MIREILHRIMTIEVMVVLAALVLGPFCVAGSPLENPDLDGIRVGAPQQAKCCQPKIEQQCGNHSYFDCELAAEKECSNAIDVKDLCPAATCDPSFETDECITDATLYGLFDLCDVTGNKINGNCPTGEKTCEWDAKTYYQVYTGCHANSVICIWAGNICPLGT